MNGDLCILSCLRSANPELGRTDRSCGKHQSHYKLWCVCFPALVVMPTISLASLLLLTKKIAIHYVASDTLAHQEEWRCRSTKGTHAYPCRHSVIGNEGGFTSEGGCRRANVVGMTCKTSKQVCCTASFRSTYHMRSTRLGSVSYAPRRIPCCQRQRHPFLFALD